MDCLTGFCAGKSKQYQLARRDSNPDEENQNLSCYQLHHGLIMGVHLSTIGPLVPTSGVTLESLKVLPLDNLVKSTPIASGQVPS